MGLGFALNNFVIGHGPCVDCTFSGRTVSLFAIRFEAGIFNKRWQVERRCFTLWSFNGSPCGDPGDRKHCWCCHGGCHRWTWCYFLDVGDCHYWNVHQICRGNFGNSLPYHRWKRRDKWRAYVLFAKWPEYEATCCFVLTLWGYCSFGHRKHCAGPLGCRCRKRPLGYWPLANGNASYFLNRIRGDGGDS